MKHIVESACPEHMKKYLPGPTGRNLSQLTPGEYAKILFYASLGKTAGQIRGILGGQVSIVAIRGLVGGRSLAIEAMKELSLIEKMEFCAAVRNKLLSRE